MSALKNVAGAVLAVTIVVATAGLGRLPVSFNTDDHALVRLSWRMDGVTAEACRERTQEELERLPVHMRNPEACIGEIAPYEIRLTLNGEEVALDTVRAAGARGDRPVYVFSDLPVEAGPHQLSVRVTALLDPGAEVGEGITSLNWDGTVVLEPREVALVTLDDSGGELVVRREVR